MLQEISLKVYLNIEVTLRGELEKFATVEVVDEVGIESRTLDNVM